MFQRILVPVDLTEKSLKAVDTAYDFAAQMGSEVALLHVIETIEHVQLEFEELRPLYDRLESSVRSGLKEFSERFVTNHLRVDQAVVYGKRAKEIVDFAIQNRSDLIIMASHRIDPDRPAHGWSISYVVAIMSPCPVLLVK
jgi:nucleotide-binding universal stress UspA family protein